MMEVAEAGMEKLTACTLPFTAGSQHVNPIIQQLMQPGMTPAQVMQGLAAQLLERSLAVTSMVKVRGLRAAVPLCWIAFGLWLWM